MDILTIRKNDIIEFNEMVGKLNEYVWAVEACGKDGKREDLILKEHANKLIKILVNYL